MRGIRLIATLAAFVAAFVGIAGDDLSVAVKESRTRVTDDPARAEFDVVDRRLTMGNLWFRYHLVVDPNHGDRPVIQKYGDYFLACGFPANTWNWNLEHFLDAQVARGAGKPFVASRAALQEGTYVLRQGEAALAEMVWPLADNAAAAPADRLAVRVLKRADPVNWFYLRVNLEGDAAASLTRVTVSGYPFTTSAPRERERWATTLSQALRLSDKPVTVDPVAEWGLVLHNRNAHEDGGALLVFDPEEVSAASVGGTYCVAVNLTPKPESRALHLAMGYFWDVHCSKAAADFRAAAAGVLQTLRNIDWTVTPDVDAWERERQVIEGLLVYDAVKAKYGAKWVDLAAAADRLLSEGPATGADAAPHAGRDRQFSATLKQARQLRSELYEAALQELVREAMQ